MLVTVATFDTPQQAHMLRGRLSVEGIFAVVSHAYHVGNNWPYSIALGGAKVQVVRTDLEAAFAVEDRARKGEYRLELQAEAGNLDDLVCPTCGSTVFWKRRPLYQGVLAVALIWNIGIFPPWRWLYCCKVCQTRFGPRYGLIGKAGFHFDFSFMEANASDVPEMASLFQSVTGVAPPERLLFPFGAPTRRAWICRLDGVLRAFSIADFSIETLAAIYVDGDFRREGIGRRLHNAAVDWLFDCAAVNISAVVAPYIKAQKFFHAAGWRLVDAEHNGDYRLQLSRTVWQRRRNRF